MRVVLISTYELGRQPFGLASPVAWLKQAGASVTCQDLAIQSLDEEALVGVDLVAFYVPMHTATRLAAGAIERVKGIAPRAHLCFYGLYAPMNESYLRRLGGDTILGGEFEEGLVSLVQRLSGGEPGDQQQVEPTVSLAKLKFQVPDRSGLPVLSKYANLRVGPDDMRTVGYTEASRGCKHLCRHCPVVPIYGGAFRIVQPGVVLEDIRQQVAAGARHITFGDPDFFNGPTHAVKLVEALHQEFADLTYDVTIKVEHLLKCSQHLPTLRDTGCLFVTCAIESVDDAALEIFDKGHTRADFVEVVDRFREIGLTMNPTFVTFHPWISLAGYLDFLNLLLRLDLIDSVSPVQYAIRLLIPEGSRLLELPEVKELVDGFDEEALVYRWHHSDPRVDRLCDEILKTVEAGQGNDESRREIFRRVWELAQVACDVKVKEGANAARLSQIPTRAEIPYLTEPWYC